VVDLNSIVMFDNSSIVEFLVDFIFSQSMLDIVVLDLITPTVIEVVDFAGDLPAVLQVKSLVHFREPALPKDRQDQVLIVEDGECLAAMDAAILGLLLVSYSLELNQVGALLLFEHLQLFFDSSFFIFKELLLELVNFTLLILVDVLKFSLLEVKLRVLIHEREPIHYRSSICVNWSRWGHHMLVLAIGLGLFVGFRSLFKFVYFFFFELDFS